MLGVKIGAGLAFIDEYELRVQYFCRGSEDRLEALLELLLGAVDASNRLCCCCSSRRICARGSARTRRAENSSKCGSAARTASPPSEQPIASHSPRTAQPPHRLMALTVVDEPREPN
jgi:hypothetical protein